MIAWICTLARLPLAALFAVLAAVGLRLYGPAANWPTVMFWSMVFAAIFEELTDLFDGMAARRFGTTSELGGLADPLCDSLARLTLYFAMALCGWVTLAVPLVMVARDIVCAYVRVVLARCAMKTSARFSGKLKAAVQAGGIFVLLAIARWADALFGPQTASMLHWLAAAMIISATAFSGLDYCRAAVPAVRQMLASG